MIGDIHGQFGALNKLINQHKNKIDMIIQCGDFGYWPKDCGKWHTDVYGKVKVFQITVKNHGIPFYFCDGNHEDHESLLLLGNNEILPNVFYMKRGSVLEVNNKNILFMGGAFSIDRAWRILGKSYFLEETIGQKDVLNLPDQDIDIVVSHTAPNEFIIPLNLKKEHDPSRDALSYILNRYQPKRWYFAHFHAHFTGLENNCKWTCYSCSGDTQKWWEVITI